MVADIHLKIEAGDHAHDADERVLFRWDKWAQMIPGATIRARVDPEDPSIFVLDWDAWEPPRLEKEPTEGRSRIRDVVLLDDLTDDMRPRMHIEFVTKQPDGKTAVTTSTLGLSWAHVPMLIVGATVDLSVELEGDRVKKVDWSWDSWMQPPDGDMPNPNVERWLREGPKPDRDIDLDTD